MKGGVGADDMLVLAAGAVALATDGIIIGGVGGETELVSLRVREVNVGELTVAECWRAG